MPFIGPAAAARNAALSSSTLVVAARRSAVKSTTLTVGVGTRRLKPSNLPLRSGMTRASALAAPVVVGMMFWPARAGAAQVLVGDVEDALVVRVGVDRGHQAAARCRAGRGRPWRPGPGSSSCSEALLMMWCVGRVVLVLVDAEDDRDVLALGRGADDDLLGAGVDVGARPSSASVKMPVLSSTMSTPRSPHGRFAGSFSARTLISRPSMMIDASPVCSTVARVGAVRRVVLEQERVHLGVDEVVDRDDLDVGRALDERLERLAADAAEAVDADAGGHRRSPRDADPARRHGPGSKGIDSFEARLGRSAWTGVTRDPRMPHRTTSGRADEGCERVASSGADRGRLRERRPDGP